MAEKRKDRDGRILPENVIQRKDGTYMWKKSVDGKQYCEYAKTLGEIKQKRNKALYEIEKGTYKGKRAKMREKEEQDKKDITLNEWFFRWEKTYREGKIRESTLRNNHRAYMSHYANTIGKRKLREIKQIDIVEFNKRMQADGLKYGTIDHMNSLISMMYEDAINNGLADINPASKALRINKERSEEKRIVTEEEERRFFEYLTIDKWHTSYIPLFTVGFYTGMRIGEILGLTWKDIDFENNQINVDHTLLYMCDCVHGGKKNFFINPPKTESSNRKIPMLPNVRKQLELLKRQNIKTNVVINGYSDFVFVGRKGNVFASQNIALTIKRIVAGFNKYEEDISRIDGREPFYMEMFTPHTMRHTFTSRCYEKGVKEKVIQKILGHSSIDMTMNVYTHITEDMIEREIMQLGRKNGAE